MKIGLILSSSYENREGEMVCNVEGSQHTLISANYNTCPTAMRENLTSQARALPTKITSLAYLAPVHNATTVRCKHSSYATIAQQAICDGYICNPCAAGASLDLIDSVTLNDDVQYMPPKMVASVDVITVDATHRERFRYCTSLGASEGLEIETSHLQIRSEVCQQVGTSYHGIMKGNIKGSNYKVMASASELLYELEWHTSFPRGEHYHI